MAGTDPQQPFANLHHDPQRKGNQDVNRLPEILALGTLALFFAGTSHAEEITPPLDSRLEISYFLERVFEPTLWDACKDKITTYRATTITPDRSVEAVRITRAGDTITIRTATSRLGEDLFVNDHSVAWEDWVQLEGFAQTMSFWHLTSKWRTFRPDGTEVYIEGCRQGKYHAIKRGPVDFEIEDFMNHVRTIVKRAEP